MTIQIIHRIFSKQPGTKWGFTFGFVWDPSGGRIVGNLDARDNLRDSPVKTEYVYKTLSPYQAIIGTYKGPDGTGNYLGYDRIFLSDDMVDIFHIFETSEQTEPTAFALEFLRIISDQQNLVVKNWFDYTASVSIPNNTIELIPAIQGSDNNILVLWDKTLTEEEKNIIKNAGIEAKQHIG